MKKNDMLKKADILNRLMERDSPNPVSIMEFCQLLRLRGLSHNHGYYHYTTWGRLQEMLTAVETGEKEKKRLFFLSASSSLNDTEEKRDGFYVASFSIGEEEEVAMWTNYGVPKHEAVRIKFPMKAMTRWVNENTTDNIVIYVQKEDGSGFHVLDVKPKEIYFADVAYYGRNDPSPDTVPDAVRYNGEKCWFKEKKWRDAVCDTDYSLLFKKRGWAYEREVRLIVQFADAGKMQNVPRIAIPFDSVYDAMLDVQKAAENKEKSKKSVMYGPWYGLTGLKLDKIKGINAPSLSSFKGELRMRSNCDRCNRKNNPQKCNCPNAEWRLLNSERK